jgi:hypothetical protein
MSTSFSEHSESQTDNPFHLEPSSSTFETREPDLAPGDETDRTGASTKSSDLTRKFQTISREDENDFTVEQIQGSIEQVKSRKQDRGSFEMTRLQREISKYSRRSPSEAIELGSPYEDNDGDLRFGEKLDRQPSTAIIDIERPGPTILFVSTSRLRTLLERLALFSLLSFASIWGVLTRLALVANGTFDGQSVFPLLWAQMFGCLIMGMAFARKEEIINM